MKIDRARLGKGIWAAFSLSLVIKVWGAVASFFLSLTVANQLSVDEAGIFFLCMAIVLLASVISRQGFDNLLVKSIARYTDEDCPAGVTQVSGWALRRVVAVATALACLVCFNAEFLAHKIFSKPNLTPMLTVISWTFITGAGIQIFVSMLKGMRASVSAIFFMTSALPTVMLVLIWFSDITTAIEAGYLYLYANLGVLIAIALMWGVRFYRRSETSITLAEVKAEYGKTLLPFFYTSILFVFIQYFTQIFVGAVLPASDVALLSVAIRVAMLISFVMVAINAVASPRVAVYCQQGQMEQLRLFANQVSRVLFCVGLIALMVVLIFAEKILLLFGREYLVAAELLRIIAIGQFINVATGSVGVILQMSGNERYFLLCVAGAGGGAVLGSLILVPLYGVTAAAIVIAVSTAFQNLLAFWGVKKRLGFYTLSFKKKAVH